MDLKTEIDEDCHAYARMVKRIGNIILKKSSTQEVTRLQAMINSTASIAKVFGVSKEQLLAHMGDRYDKVEELE